MKKITHNGKDILIVNIGENYFAMTNTCTHAGGDLSKGVLDGKIVKCPKHGSRFDVTTGKLISGPKILFLTLKVKDESSFPVKIDGNDVLIDLGSAN